MMHPPAVKYLSQALLCGNVSEQRLGLARVRKALEPICFRQWFDIREVERARHQERSKRLRADAQISAATQSIGLVESITTQRSGSSRAILKYPSRRRM